MKYTKLFMIVNNNRCFVLIHNYKSIKFKKFYYFNNKFFIYY